MSQALPLATPSHAKNYTKNWKELHAMPSAMRTMISHNHDKFCHRGDFLQEP